jgi:uncharacterized protein
MSSSVDRDQPLVFCSAHHEEVYDDCACPGTAVTTTDSIPFGDNTQWVQVGESYCDALPDGHHLVYSPFMPGGPVSLNHSAWQRWQTFRQPAGIMQPVDGVFQSQRLLQPVGKEYRLVSSPPDALTVWMHITDACNMRCSYCYVPKTSRVMSLEVGRAVVDAAIRSARQHHMHKLILKYAGGEPTLYLTRVLELHRYAGQQVEAAGLQLDGVILSNGLAWTAERIRAVQLSGLRVMLSLDGLGAAQDAQRTAVNGTPTSGRIRSTLDQMVEAHIHTVVSITLTNRNLEEVPDLVDYLLQRQQRFTVNFYRENDCVPAQTDLHLSPDAVKATFDKIYALLEAHLPAYPVFGDLLDRVRLDRAHTLPCGVGSSYLVADTQGGFSRCHMTMDHPLADLHHPDPLRVIEVDLGASHNVRVDLKEGCHNCSWRYGCAGGCPLINARAAQPSDRRSKYCEIYQALIPDLLRLEGLRLIRYGIPAGSCY